MSDEIERLESRSCKAAQGIEHHALTEVLGSPTPITEAHLQAHTNRINAFLEGPMQNLVAKFESFRSSPQAAEFAGFFEYCDQQAKNGEPAYQRLKQNNIG